MNGVILPPEPWKFIPNQNVVEIDGDWKWILQDKNNEPYYIYAYGIVDFPELIKIGITEDLEKRIESYYDLKVCFSEKLDKRNCRILEYLFLNSTYHKGYVSPPTHNIGNKAFTNTTPTLKKFFETFGERLDSISGLTEIREMNIFQARDTIQFILDYLYEWNDQSNWWTHDLFDVITTFGIKTWNDTGGIRGKIQIQKGVQYWNQTKEDIELLNWVNPKSE